MDKADLGHHISQQYNQELEDVRNRVLQMGGLVEQQLADAVQALTTMDTALAEVVDPPRHNRTVRLQGHVVKPAARDRDEVLKGRGPHPVGQRLVRDVHAE